MGVTKINPFQAAHDAEARTLDLFTDTLPPTLGRGQVAGDPAELTQARLEFAAAVKAAGYNAILLTGHVLDPAKVAQAFNALRGREPSDTPSALDYKREAVRVRQRMKEQRADIFIGELEDLLPANATAASHRERRWEGGNHA